MGIGPVDHPAYLARQSALLTTASTAGANTVQVTAGLSFPFDVRIRNAVASVQVAGTSATTGNQVVFYIPGTSVTFPNAAVSYAALTATGTVTAITTNTTTTTVGTIVLGSSVAGVNAISGDMNVKLPAGQALFFKNGTDATGRYSVMVEYHIDPGTGAWTGT